MSLGRIRSVLLVVLVVAATVGYFVAPTSAFDVRSDARWMAPHWGAPLGTDRLGRDLSVRLWLGTTAFVLPGALAGVLAIAGGTLLGALGFYRPSPWAPRRSHWLWSGLRLVSGLVVDTVLAIPRFVFLLLVFASTGFGAVPIAAGAGVMYAAVFAEALRVRGARLLDEDYILTARLDGVNELRILGHHILWLNGRDLMARAFYSAWAFVLVLEVSLSFIPGGFGVQEPTPSWGNMLGGATRSVRAGELLPAAVVTLAIILVGSLIRGSATVAPAGVGTSEPRGSRGASA